jgi:hypothetical protein
VGDVRPVPRYRVVELGGLLSHETLENFKQHFCSINMATLKTSRSCER